MNGAPIYWPMALRRVQIFLLNAFWIAPGIAATAAIFMARSVSKMDYTTPMRFGGLMTTSGPAGARDMVQTVTTSSLTVVTLVFSIMVVVLQVAGSQYSPRLPAQFLRDTSTQLVLAVFVFTFVYSLSIVRSIGANNDFVPNFAVTTCFLAVITCMAAFIYFVHHIVHSVRIEKVLRHVERETIRSLGRLVEGTGTALPSSRVPAIPKTAKPLKATFSGTIQRIDGHGLVEQARAQRLVVCFVVRAGDVVAEGTPIAWAWSDQPFAAPGDTDALGRRLRSVILWGEERVFFEDFGYGITQLVDIALRALSPAINDPTSACMAIRSLETVFAQVARKDPRTSVLRDVDGKMRVVIPRQDFSLLMTDAVGSLCHAAEDDAAVLRSLALMLGALAYAVIDNRQRAVVSAQLTRIESHALDAVQDITDRERIKLAIRDARRALGGAPPVRP